MRIIIEITANEINELTKKEPQINEVLDVDYIVKFLHNISSNCNRKKFNEDSNGKREIKGEAINNPKKFDC